MASELIVERARGMFSLFQKKLQCDWIIGKRISISLTEANKVEGEEVIIGPNCRIHTLRYSKNYTIDPSSTVQQIIKIGEDTKEVF